MDFHFRSQPIQTNNDVRQSYSKKRLRTFLEFFREYFAIRFRQLRIISALLVQFSGAIVTEVKAMVVRNMYWGRTSFYKTAFHILVIIITLSALYSGLGTKIVSSQRDSLENISVSSRTYIDSDLVAQQGSLTPLEAFDNNSDSVYFDYVVKQGDSLQKIADKNKISIDTLRWANNIPAGRDTLKVGQTIKVPKMNGVLHEVAEGETVDKILAKVKLNDKQADKLTFLELNSQHIDSEGNPIPGSIVFIPDAVIVPTRTTTSRPTTGGGTTVIPQAPPSNVPAGTFVNPMQYCGYSFNRGYSYGHTGVDLGTNPGCWIAAAGSGVVVRANWCYSLGYCVVIKHGGGYSTVYGHGNGVFAVSAGQTVVAGQKIMQSGCTGYCFGPHLHLSLAANNNDVYSCYRCRINPAGIIPY